MSSKVTSTEKAATAIWDALLASEPDMIPWAIANEAATLVLADESWDASERAAMEFMRDEILRHSGPTRVSPWATKEQLQTLLDASAFPQKTATGLDGGKVTKAEAQRQKSAAIERREDKVAQAKSSAWIERQLDAAQSRTKKFGHTGGLKTGTLSPVQLVHRIKGNFRTRK